MPQARRTLPATGLLALMLALVLSLLLPAAPAQAAGDDYPSAYKYQTNTYAMDRWGFTQRQCVSFVAWRMEQRGKVLKNTGTSATKWGHAYHWNEAAAARGRVVSRTPKVGAIAQWNANESSKYYASNGATGTITAGKYGHVGYVSYVYSDGSVKVEQYNLFNSRKFSSMRVKAPRYLYWL